MIHSKEYLEARKHAQALKEMQALIEKDIFNNKDSFLENGYIPFSLETRNYHAVFYRTHYTCCMEFLNNWLSSWGWEIKVNEQTPERNYALFAIES